MYIKCFSTFILSSPSLYFPFPFLFFHYAHVHVNSSLSLLASITRTCNFLFLSSLYLSFSFLSILSLSTPSISHLHVLSSLSLYIHSMTPLDMALTDQHTLCINHFISLGAHTGGGVVHNAVVTIQRSWKRYVHKV